MPTAFHLRIAPFWKLQIAGWGCLYVLVMAAALPSSSEPGLFRFNTLGWALLFAASFLIHAVFRRMVQRQLGLPALASWAFALAAIAGSAIATLAGVVTYGIRHVNRADWTVASIQCTLILFLWCSVYFVIKQWQAAASEREQRLVLERQMQEARLNALRYQLNPHFLFNALNGVSTLYLEGGGEAASEMLGQIGDLLRAVLEGISTPTIPLQQEIELTEKYLAIEKSRLGSRLHVDVNIDPQAADFVVPPMLLQPIVENAIKHGIGSAVGPGWLSILGSLHQGILRLSIRNSGPPRVHPSTPAPAFGIGLTNTRERLNTLYAAKHRFSVNWPDEGGCEIVIEISPASCAP
jgi:hypothetical protein